MKKSCWKKISTLDEKLNASESSIDKLNEKITNLQEKLEYLESQNKLKSRKEDDLEQWSGSAVIWICGRR